MSKNNENDVALAMGSRDVLTEILRTGARRMLIDAIEDEVAAYLEQHANERDEQDHRFVVRNGVRKGRTIQTGVGTIEFDMPRVDDRRLDEHGQRRRFTSAILPPYLRKTKTLEEFVPWLYLKGISTGDMGEVLESLLGPAAKGFSATTVVRLKTQWQREWQTWSHRSLKDKRYVYFWADGVYFNVRLEEEGNAKQCILVLMGATDEGKKELIAIADGYRESEQSWRELLLDVKARGLAVEPKLATGDGAMGFWAALKKVFPTTREQRCWVHKTANVLNKLPPGLQAKAKAMLHDIWMAPTRAEAEKAFDLVVKTFEMKYLNATTCLSKDRSELLAFYDFPAEHWVHLRTSNPIESTFATVRLRTNKTKGSGSRTACLTMVFKLAKLAEHHWRTLNGSQLLDEVIRGIKFMDGIKDLACLPEKLRPAYCIKTYGTCQF
jgi:transposase-like protein